MAVACPICGEPGQTCIGQQTYRMPVDMEDLQIMGNAMAVDTVKARMPQQSVHAGRGVAGYRGNVEVYDPQTGKTVATPKSVKRISGTKAKDGPGEDK